MRRRTARVISNQRVSIQFGEIASADSEEDTDYCFTDYSRATSLHAKRFDGGPTSLVPRAIVAQIIQVLLILSKDDWSVGGRNS